MSDKVMAIFRRYDPTMQPAGCDEGYLKYAFYIYPTWLYLTESRSITAYCEKHSVTAEDCVQGMRKKVCDETHLTVSAGIAPNKVS